MQVLVQSSVWGGLKNGRSKASSISKCLCAHVGNAVLHRQLPIVAAPRSIKALRKGEKSVSGRCPRYLLGLQTVWVAGAAGTCGDWGWGQFSECETGEQQEVGFLPWILECWNR